jgi:alpha-beta hydrolase superfamily lysophospholipase
VVVGNSLGGVTAPRLAEREDLPLAGVVPVAPAGLQMPRWFDVIERDPLVRRLLGLPLPIAPPVLCATVGEIYRQLVFARPRSAEAAVSTSPFRFELLLPFPAAVHV